jgi:hypothetical protein
LRPADPELIASDEKCLGFLLPPLLKRIYSEIGNGGFGPGYGLIGLTNGVPDDTGKTAPDIYAQFRDTHVDEAGLKWPLWAITDLPLGLRDPVMCRLRRHEFQDARLRSERA